MARFEVYVVPGSVRPGPDGTYSGIPRLRVKSPPDGGRANAEAEKFLSKTLGGNVKLVSGAGSRRKVFESEGTEASVRARLREAFGD